uniref:Uncharacterized protein n=1 Tax=Manihot esculenta TaxID=3983 RepID=A0A2C9VIQ0_MANES
MVNIAGGGNVEKAKAVQASLFAVGINTMLQIWIGTRLSVSMESSQAYIIPIISIALSTFSNYSDSLDSHQVAKCIEIGLPALAILVFLTQFLPRIWKAKKEMVGQVAIVLSVSIVWIYAEILTAAGAYDNTTQQTQTYCRTDSSGLIDAAPWIKIPRPFQWGTPIFEAGDALSMMAASLVAVIESSGTFLASSKLSGAPPIPPSALTRGIGTQGIGTMIDAVFGTGNGSTASVEDAGLLGLTQVGSRRVVIVSAIFLVFLSILGKVGAFFASIPLPIVGALHTLLFPYVASTGLEYLEYCNVNSFRSKLILGFSLFMGLSVPQYFKEYVFLTGHGPVHTGSTWFNDLIQVIFSSPPTVALIVAFFLDRTHTPRARSTWKDSGRHFKKQSDESEKTREIYDLITSLGDMCS